MLKFNYNYGDVMKNNLYEELYDLQKKEEDIKINLDIQYFDRKRRTFLFNELDKTKKEIEKIRFKIKMKEKINNEKSRETI